MTNRKRVRTREVRARFISDSIHYFPVDKAGEYYPQQDVEPDGNVKNILDNEAEKWDDTDEPRDCTPNDAEYDIHDYRYDK